MRLQIAAAKVMPVLMEELKELGFYSVFLETFGEKLRNEVVPLAFCRGHAVSFV